MRAGRFVIPLKCTRKKAASIHELVAKFGWLSRSHFIYSLKISFELNIKKCIWSFFPQWEGYDLSLVCRKFVRFLYFCLSVSRVTQWAVLATIRNITKWLTLRPKNRSSLRNYFHIAYLAGRSESENGYICN